ncbi:ABC transporter permease [Streptosporangiaceae bacterium NEAU-GS5]|nr:ABC transporter permease [Streptosporangiaceae bacterium NEAU-GS5]
MANQGFGGPPPKVAFIQPIVTGILIGTAFLLVFLFALHHPSPRHVPVGVVGAPAGVVSTLNSGGAIDAVALRDEAQARDQVAKGEVDAAYVAGAPQAQLLVAGARGPLEVRTLSAIFTPIAEQSGATLKEEDVVPIDPDDPNGISVFYLIFGMTLGAFLFGQGVHAFGKMMPLARKVLQTVVFSAALSIIATAITVGWVGVLPGNALAVGGVMFLLAGSIGALTIAITTILGDIGVAVATIIALIFGTAVSGGAAPADFLPAGFGAFSSWLPPGAAVRALRDVVYYDAGAAFGPVLILLAWIVASAVVVVGVTTVRGKGAPATVHAASAPAAAASR